MKTKESKQGTSFRLSHEGRRLIVALADKLGLSQASLLEMLIRERARKEGVK